MLEFLLTLLKVVVLPELLDETLAEFIIIGCELLFVMHEVKIFGPANLTVWLGAIPIEEFCGYIRSLESIVVV